MATRRPHKPLEKPTGTEESRRTNALLEEVRKEVSLVAEGVVDLQRRLKRVEEETASLPPLRDEVKSLGDILRAMARDLDGVRFSTAKTSHETEALKTELRLVRSDLSAYAKRLETAETKLAP